MSHPHILLYSDLIEHATDFIGGSSAAYANGQIRGAIQDAYRQLTELRRWTYLLTPYRISVPAKYSTGTVAYTHSGYQLTLSGGTWPSWAASGAVQIGRRVHHVSTRDSDTVLTLNSAYNPGANVDAGTSYVIFQRIFSLPTDFVSLDMPYQADRWKLGRFRYANPNDFLSTSRGGEGSGSPYLFTVMGDPSNNNQMAIFTQGEPNESSIEDLDFIYYRRPRQMVISGFKDAHQQGTVSTAATTALTGIGTAFSSDMVGAYVRVSDHVRNRPTGIDGIYPFAEERKISAYGSATSLTVSSAFSQTQTRRAYAISDYADIEPSMYTALRRFIEAHIAARFDKKNKAEQQQLWDIAYKQAAGIDDSRVYLPREVGDGEMHGPRPAGAVAPDDVSGS